MKCSKCGTIINSGRFCPECGNEVVTSEMIRQEKIELAKKRADEIVMSYHPFHVKGDIPSKKINNAIASYAPRLDRNTIIGLYDTTITENGKEGVIFTDSEIYYKVYLKSPVRIAYADIDHMDWRTIYLKNGDEERFDIECSTRMGDFVNELLAIDKKYGVKPPKRKVTKYDIVEKYGRKLSTWDFYIKGAIPNKILKNAIKKYASEVSSENVLGLIDTTVMDSGKTGMLFTEKAMYQNIEDDFHRKIYYKDIRDVEKADYSDVKITFVKDDSGTWYSNTSRWYDVDRDVFVEFLNEMRRAD